MAKEKPNRMAEELGEESSYEGKTEMKRRVRRGDESKGDPDARDVAGAPSVGETPEARENHSATHVNTPSAPRRERSETAPGKLKRAED